jgi:hypothetical protein
MDIIFEKKEDVKSIVAQHFQSLKTRTLVSQESELLNNQSSLGIQVQSVALPTKNYSIAPKTEAQVIKWLENKVHNVNTAFYKINSKYTGDNERVNWNNNKMQNKRFLEIKNLFKKGLYYH